MCQKFLIASPSDPSAVLELLEKAYPNCVYSLGTDLVLAIESKDSIQDIAKQIAFKDHKIGTGLIVGFDEVNGYYDQKFWKWIHEKEGTALPVNC